MEFNINTMIPLLSHHDPIIIQLLSDYDQIKYPM